MNCELFSTLNTLEKVDFMGKLCHATQTDDTFFSLAAIVVKAAEDKGMFDRIKFNQNTEPVAEIVETYINNLTNNEWK